ncbi:MAG: hypothetical protein IJN80_00025 [Clostridia bacterium]|nr:hypothetical protein [Clostridia bacterium]
MRRFTAILLAMALLLCGCSVEWEDTAAPDTAVENQPQGSASKENKNGEEAEIKEQESSTEKEQELPHAETGGAAQKEEIKTLGKLDSESESAGGAYLYGDTAYYSVSCGGKDYLYALRLGKGETPQYLCEGTVSGIYGSILIGSLNGKYAALDLSKKTSVWTTLSALMEEEEHRFVYEGKLLVFGEREIEVIDLEELTDERVKLGVEIEEAVLSGEDLFYSVENGEEQVLYRGDMKSKKSTQLIQCDSEYDWVQAGERIFLAKEGENPYVLDLETGKTFVPRRFYCDLTHGPDTPVSFNLGNGTVCVRYRDEGEDLYSWKYWLYHIAENYGEDVSKKPEHCFEIDNGYYYRAEQGLLQVVLNQKEYRLSGKGVSSANEYGAAYAEGGLIYTVRWSEGNSYEYSSVTDHPAPKV